MRTILQMLQSIRKKHWKHTAEMFCQIMTVNKHNINDMPRRLCDVCVCVCVCCVCVCVCVTVLSWQQRQLTAEQNVTSLSLARSACSLSFIGIVFSSRFQWQRLNVWTVKWSVVVIQIILKERCITWTLGHSRSLQCLQAACNTDAQLA